VRVTPGTIKLVLHGQGQIEQRTVGCSRVWRGRALDGTGDEAIKLVGLIKLDDD
jgi:hypothetical protein